MRHAPIPRSGPGGIPVLGICYGLQLMAHAAGRRGGAVSTKREYGPAPVQRHRAGTGCSRGLDRLQPVWMSHGDRSCVRRRVPAHCPDATRRRSPAWPIRRAACTASSSTPRWSTRPIGREVLRNFVVEHRRRATRTGRPANFVDTTVAEIRERVGDGNVICALSGGVDSAVAATLVHRAIGDQLTCIYVDHGLMRKRESELLRVDLRARTSGMKLVMVDARERFLQRLAGVEDPEEKRRIIGDEFIRVFEEEAAKLGQIDFLTQGTLYPDVIESKTAETKTSRPRSRPTTTSAACRRTCASS